jgi:hypothetical protein
MQLGVIQYGLGVPVAENQGELLPDPLAFPTSLLKVLLILDLLLKKLFNNILKSDYADFFEDWIAYPAGILTHLCHNCHVKLAPFKELQYGLQLGLMIDCDDLPDQDTRKLLQGRQIIVYIR